MPHEWLLYTRAGCHLCETAEEWLRDWADEHGATLTLINILADLAVYEQYKWKIPVLVIGELVWAAPLDEQQIKGEARLGITGNV